PDAGPLGRGRFRRADVEVAIDLPRVGGDDLGAEALGEVERERALPARGGADDADEAHWFKSSGGPSGARPLRGLRSSDAPRPRRPARRLSAPASPAGGL